MLIHKYEGPGRRGWTMVLMNLFKYVRVVARTFFWDPDGTWSAMSRARVDQPDKPTLSSRYDLAVGMVVFTNQNENISRWEIPGMGCWDPSISQWRWAREASSDFSETKWSSLRGSYCLGWYSRCVCWNTRNIIFINKTKLTIHRSVITIFKSPRSKDSP